MISRAKTLCWASEVIMKRWFPGVILAGLVLGGTAQAQQPATMRAQPPELADVTEWINSKPLKFADLRGQVVVVNFWTFG